MKAKEIWSKLVRSLSFKHRSSAPFQTTHPFDELVLKEHLEQLRALAGSTTIWWVSSCVFAAGLITWMLGEHSPLQYVGGQLDKGWPNALLIIGVALYFLSLVFYGFCVVRFSHRQREVTEHHLREAKYHHPRTFAPAYRFLATAVLLGMITFVFLTVVWVAITYTKTAA